MVLRSGAKVGPAGRWDKAGALAGVAAVVVLVAFVVVAAGTRDGYSHVDDSISQLGAHGTSGVWWFFAVNVAGALLIVLFAYGAHRRLPVGLATGAFLGAVAFGALLVGAFPCSGECLPRTSDAHGVAAAFTAFMIVGFLVAAAVGLRHRTAGWLRYVTFACAGANVVLGLALLTRDAGAGDVGLLERLFWASAYVWVLAASWAIIRATRRRDPPAFDPTVLQRKLLRSPSSWIHSAYATFSIDDPAAAKLWISDAIDQANKFVLRDDATTEDGSATLAFTCAGLRVLGVDYRGDDAFSQGMRARAAALGDVGDGEPGHWQKHWRRDDIHLLVWIEAKDSPTRSHLLAKVSQLAGSGGLSLIGTDDASSRLNTALKPLDHRDFRDGISQPWVLLNREDKAGDERMGGGIRDEFDEWRPLAVGEFVLGERDESNDVARVPEPKQIFEHGSFLVVRKLAQDLVGLDAFITTESQRLGVPDLEEQLLGRRRNGDRLDGSPAAENKFTFGQDAEGLQVCPLGAHIRRANPRDALGFGMKLSARHRIIRRGNTYTDDPNAQPPWTDGLMFLAVNARIDDQFEFIQRLWLNDGDRQRLGATRDVVAGSSQATSTAIVHTPGGPKITSPIPVFVRTMGGEYFFAPSMAGLEALARS